MKRKNVLYALLCLLVLTTMGSFKSSYLLNEDDAAVLPPPPQFTKTQNFTVFGNGNTGKATLQYNSTGIYLTPTATINGVGNVPLHMISHLGGTVNTDKWQGTVTASGFDYTVTMVINGLPGKWNIEWVNAYSIA